MPYYILKKHFIMFKTTVKTLLLFIFCMGVKTLDAQLPYDPTQHILIKFDATASAADINSIKAEFNATEAFISYPSEIRLWYISLPVIINGTDTLSNIHEVVNGMSSKPKVKTVGPDSEFTAQYFVNNPDYGGGWVDPLVECENGHEYDFSPPKTYVSEDLIRKIAIVDTGIAINRKEGSFFSHPTIFDDYFSTSYIGYDFIGNDMLPEDENGHGTHIAGIIALENQAGADYPMRLYAYKAFDQNGVSSLGLMVRAIDRAILDGANMINASFGFLAEQLEPGETSPFKELMLVAEANNVLVIAAAGNEHDNNDDSAEPTFPASYDVDNILAVAAGDCEGELAYFSNYGEKSVDLVAPGVEIVGPIEDGKWAIKSGTSQATAFVTYVAGVLSFQGPFNYEQVKCAILSGVTSHNSLAGYVATRGLLHLQGAMHVFDDCKPSNYLRSLPSISFAEKEEDIQVFPNPFVDEIGIKWPVTAPGKTSITLRDIQGRVLQQLSHQLTGQRDNIQFKVFTKLPAGVYYLQISNQENSYTKKLIKQ